MWWKVLEFFSQLLHASQKWILKGLENNGFIQSLSTLPVSLTFQNFYIIWQNLLLEP